MSLKNSNFYFMASLPQKSIPLIFCSLSKLQQQSLGAVSPCAAISAAKNYQEQCRSGKKRVQVGPGSDNKWMKTSFFPIDNMLQQNIQTSPIADYFLKGNIRVITTMPCKPLLDRGFVTPCRRLFFLFWVTLLILYFPAISCGTIFPGMKRCERHQIPRLC